MKRFLLVALGFALSTKAHAQTSTERLQRAATIVEMKTDYYPAPHRSKATNLRFERLAVARNELALKWTREALAQDANAPTQSTKDDAGEVLARNWKTRDLARLLVWESDVRFSDGDARGAMNSRLDALQLALLTARGGGFMDALVGSAVQSLATGNIEPVAAKLDAQALQNAANRLRFLESRRPTFVDVLQTEKERTLREFRGYFNSPDWAEIVSKPTTLGFDETELALLRTLSQAQIEANISRVYDDAIQRAKLPYPQAKTTEIAPAADAYSRLMTGSAEGFQGRWSFERTRLQSLLLQAALERKVARLQKVSSTPELPPDPFGNGSLQFKNGVIYSVGPDGIDNGGTPFRTESLWFDVASGSWLKRVNTRTVLPETKGDVLAPIF